MLGAGVAPNLLAPGVGVSEVNLIGVGCAHRPGVGVSPTPPYVELNLDGVAPVYPPL